MENWREALNGDPVPWLLGDDAPAVKHMALRLLLEEPEDSPRVRRAQKAAMRVDPIAAILAAQSPEGWWVKPGPGYAPKYRGTTWSVIFLDQLGADGRDPQVRRACAYVLSHSQTLTGGFGADGAREEGPPAPSRAIHCLNGNLLRALIGLGWLGDERVRDAIDWQARTITGEGFDGYYASGTSGPGFACAANYKLPCAWGAIKGLRGLARIPPRQRKPHVRRSIDEGVEFLLSRDPAEADYPTGSTVNSSWFKLGFPSGYVTDVLQNLEVLAELGHAKDPCLSNSIEWLLSLQDGQGRWRNRYAYNGKIWTDLEKQGAPSKWVTLRACSVLKQALG
jgi:hypothetical protein